MPLGVRQLVHLRQSLVDPVFAKDVQARGNGLAAHGDIEAFGDGDDRDFVRMAAGASYAFANLRKVLGERHRIATMAPKRVPSGWRRCDGKRQCSLGQVPMSKIGRTPWSSICARWAPGASG